MIFISFVVYVVFVVVFNKIFADSEPFDLVKYICSSFTLNLTRK